MRDKVVLDELTLAAYALANTLQVNGVFITARVSVEGNYDGAPVHVVFETNTLRRGLVVPVYQLVYAEPTVRAQMIIQMTRELAMKLIQDITAEAFNVQSTASAAHVQRRSEEEKHTR